MHIPDAYLSPATQAAMLVVMTPLWVVAAKQTRARLSSKQTPLLSMGAAFCFAIQMFNIPAVGGTTAHALGAGLLAILVGPWAALLGMTLTLVIQALLFGDGGILSLGANCFNMAFIAPIVSYGLYKLVSAGAQPGSGRQVFGAGIGAYAGTVLASLSAGILLGIQPGIAHDALGHALYCPFGLGVSVPAMVMSHMLVAAPAEAVITVAALAYLWRSFPDLVSANIRPKVGQGFRLARGLVWVLVLTPIGLIATGDAFGEWDLETLQKMIGYAPKGIAGHHALVRPLLPDYGFAGLEGKPWLIAGYLVSALVGCALVALFTRGLVRKGKVARVWSPSPRQAKEQVPAWLLTLEPGCAVAGRSKNPWLEKTILRMRGVLAQTMATEQIAAANGLLQAINPLAKTIGFFSALIATGLARSPAPLVAILLVGLVAASLSRVPLKSFLTRVVGSVIFFGAVLAIPVSLRMVTPGPLAFSIGSVGFSVPGLSAGVLLLLRLATGISLAGLWHMTTRWFELLKTLRNLGVPSMFLNTAAITYRYLFVMMETLGEMVEARTSRQVGACSKKQARTYAGAGTAILFAKSVTYTEEMHWAMVSRSCEGPRKSRERARWTLFDTAVAMTGVFAILCSLLYRSHHVA